MLEDYMQSNINPSNLCCHIDRHYLRIGDLTISNSGNSRVSHRDGRFTTCHSHVRGYCVSIIFLNMHPLDVISTIFRIRNTIPDKVLRQIRFIINHSILELHLRLEDFDVGLSITRFLTYRCTVCTSTIIFGPNSHSYRVGLVISNTIQFSYDLTILVLNLDSNCDIFILPAGQPVIDRIRGQIQVYKVYIANLNGCAGLQLVSGKVSEKINILLSCFHSHIADRNINLRFVESQNRILSICIFIDACTGVGVDIIAAEETIFGLDIEADYQLVTAVTRCAIFSNRANIVFSKVKSTDTDLIAIQSGNCTLITAACSTEDKTIVVLSGALIGIQLNTRNRCIIGQSKGRRDDVFDDRFGTQRCSRTAFLNLVRDLLEDVVQRVRVRRREIVARSLWRSFIVGKILHEPVGFLCIIITSLISSTGCICTVKNSDGVNICT